MTIDRHSIRAAEDWKARLGALIAEPGTVVFILSPDSVGSEICRWEFEQAATLSKRIIPVLAQPLGEEKWDAGGRTGALAEHVLVNAKTRT